MGVVVVDNGEGDKLVLVLELWFFHYLVEQLGNLGWRVLEGTASKGAENK